MRKKNIHLCSPKGSFGQLESVEKEVKLVLFVPFSLIIRTPLTLLVSRNWRIMSLVKYSG